MGGCFDLPFAIQDQQFLSDDAEPHTLFAVTDFKLDVSRLDVGLGYGLTPASDRFVVETIVGYAFSVPGADSTASASGPVNPMSRSSARTAQR